MNDEQIQELVNKYSPEYSFPGGFEHRVDKDSSLITYALVREWKPTNILEVGTSHGGISCVLMSALIKNKKKFRYTGSELLDPEREETRLNVKSHCGVEPKLIGDITKNLKKIPDNIDLFFLDNDHDLKTTEWIVENIFPKIKKGGIMMMHDWAVVDEGGRWIGKADQGTGGWPETQKLMDMHKEGTFPFEKVYFAYRVPIWYAGGAEYGVFRKK